MMCGMTRKKAAARLKGLIDAAALLEIIESFLVEVGMSAREYSVSCMNSAGFVDRLRSKPDTDLHISTVRRNLVFMATYTAWLGGS